MKKIAILLLVVFCTLFSASIALAGPADPPANTDGGTSTKTGGVLETIRSKSNDKAIEDQIDQSTAKVVNTARTIALIIALLLLMWILYSLLWSANPQGLAQMKIKITSFVVALWGALFTETILGWLLNVFGYKL